MPIDVGELKKHFSSSQISWVEAFLRQFSNTIDDQGSFITALPSIKIVKSLQLSKTRINKLFEQINRLLLR